MAIGNLQTHSKPEDTSPQGLDRVPTAVAHLMNEIRAERESRGLAVFNMNQGLVFHPDVAEELTSSEPAWQMGPVPGLESLREEIANWRASSFRHPISSKNVMITVGANNAIALILLALSKAGDEVLLPAPYFFNHLGCIRALERIPQICPLLPEQDFEADGAALTRGWNRGAPLLLISDPHNPTGTVLDRAKLIQFESGAKQSQGRLIIDQSYFGFDFREKIERPAKFDLSTTVVVGSFSKTLSLGDYRLGYLIAHEETIARAINIQDNLVICPSMFVQESVLEVLRQREVRFARSYYLLRRRSEIFDALLQNSPAIRRFSGYAGPFKWIQLQTDHDWEFAVGLARATGVITTPGSAYGFPGWLRATFGMLRSEQEITAAWQLVEQYARHSC